MELALKLCKGDVTKAAKMIKDNCFVIMMGDDRGRQCESVDWQPTSGVKVFWSIPSTCTQSAALTFSTSLSPS